MKNIIFNKLETHPNRNPLSTEPETGKLITSFIELFGGGSILELGCHIGYTTAQLCEIKNSTVVSIDTQPNILPDIIEYYKNLTFINSLSFDAIKSFIKQKRKFDFIYIDDNHYYDYIMDLVPLLEQISNKPCYWFFHDYNQDEVKKAVDEIKYTKITMHPKNRRGVAIVQI